MVSRKPGDVARLTYDGPPVEPGDYLRTSTGRLYRVHSKRVQTRGKHTGRQHLVTTVMEPGHKPEPGVRVRRFVWYRR